MLRLRSDRLSRECGWWRPGATRAIVVLCVALMVVVGAIAVSVFRGKGTTPRSHAAARLNT